MALSLQQYPTSPNVTNNNLVYLCTSTQVTQPQFQFVVDIKDESDVLIQRVKQQPNPSSKGVFDLGNILSTQLGPTDEAWKTTTPQANTFSGGDFNIYFGEEYGTSTSSSVTLYTGVGATVGDPGVTIPTQINFLLDGFANPNDLVDWNWNSGSKYEEEDPGDDVTFTHQFGLTDYDVNSVRVGDYGTISFLRGNLNGNGDNPNSAQDVFAATYRQYDSSGALLDTDILYDTFSGLRTLQTQFWSDVYTSQDENTRLVHYPAGPQNLEDVGVPILGDTAYYTVTFNSQATDSFVNADGVWGEYRFDITTANCGYDGVRFAYKNQYGVWDYYNFALAETTVGGVERQEYKQTFVDYSNTDNDVAYDRARRGKNNYYNKVTKQRTANTDYLTQVDADNLRELFFSTDVYVQDGTAFLPVVINNVSVTEKTNPRSQKLFRFTAEYQYANGQRSRR
jgi:hypothetical protein